jgi:hypothetical protein
MGILQNGFRDTVGVFRTYGATISNNAYPQGTLGNYNLTGAKRNITAGEGITDDKVGIPMGYVMKGWQMPQKPGQLSARAYDIAITAAATGILGLPGEGSASFSLTTNNPAGELIVSGSGSAEFSITTNIPLLTASINGEGSAEFSITTNTPILGAIADLAGATTFTIATNNPTMLPLDDSSPLRTASATFSFTGSLISYAIGHMEGNALPYTELSPQSLASAVWESPLVDYQTTGSAGKALGSASSGGVDLDLMAAAVWSNVTRTLTSGGDGATPEDIAAAVRLELATELARIDLAISTRLATASYTAPDNASIAALPTLPEIVAANIPVNVQQVNGVTITGSGTEADPMRPA